ncbi:MAG TPA: 2OG-Fe(II) oxygenase family protein [Alphaproteobacteria bacterium]|nr:2OG-Fe(II) oxygenase family protein [Alphaproteobacteria bacterium]
MAAVAVDYRDYLPLVRQLEQQGYLRIPIAEQTRQTLDRCFDLANHYFAQSPAEKQRFARPEIVEGYRELGPEYSQVPERPDLTESFSAWNRNRERSDLEGWAAACPFHAALRAAGDSLEVITRAMFKAMAETWSPGAPELRFYRGTYVQLNYYEPARHSRELLQDSHEDGHLITVLRSNAPGLELDLPGGVLPIETNGNDLVMMPGALLSLMTGNKIKPCYHQVRNNHRTTPRCSMMYFVNPEIDQVLKPWISNETNAGIDIIERANAAPKQFGMPTLEDSLTGHAETRAHSFAGAAQ